jgi:hypothetical protein
MPYGHTRSLRAVSVAALSLAFGITPSAPAEAKPVRCDAGATFFLDGGLRLFSIPFRGSFSGDDEYACLAPGRRSLGIGQEGSDEGTGSSDTPAYAFAGGRYLAALQTDDGEGGPSAFYEVLDLKLRKRVTFANTAFDDSRPPFRVSSLGHLVTADGTAEMVAPGARKATALSTPGVEADQVALVGGTVYWTEHPAGQDPTARSVALAGVPDGPEPRMFEPVSIPNPNGRCAHRKGQTIARSPAVRVFRKGSTRRVACRIGRSQTVLLPAQEGAHDLRIVNDRWIFTLDAGVGTVVDSKRGKVVTTTGPSVGVATVLDDGTLAWIEQGGRLVAQQPATDTVTELAAAADAPAALASSGRTVYWTAGGSAHRWVSGKG